MSQIFLRSKCKDPEAEVGLVCSGNMEKTILVGADREKGRVSRDEAREIIRSPVAM